jgi:hypothetical protein
MLGVRRYSSSLIRIYLKEVLRTPLFVLTLGLHRYVIKGVLQSTVSDVLLTELIRALPLLGSDGPWIRIGQFDTITDNLQLGAGRSANSKLSAPPIIGFLEI